MRFTVLCAAALAAVLMLSSCGESECEKLVNIACKHIEKRRDGDEECERLKKWSESVSEESCQKTMLLLKETQRLDRIKP